MSSKEIIFKTRKWGKKKKNPKRGAYLKRKDVESNKSRNSKGRERESPKDGGEPLKAS